MLPKKADNAKMKYSKMCAANRSDVIDSSAVLLKYFYPNVFFSNYDGAYRFSNHLFIV